MPVIPATQEAEAGESLEPGRQRLQRAEIVPLYSSLGNKIEIPSQKRKKERERERKEKRKKEERKRKKRKERNKEKIKREREMERKKLVSPTALEARKPPICCRWMPSNLWIPLLETSIPGM